MANGANHLDDLLTSSGYNGLWQETFDAVQDVVWVLDLDHRIVRANRASEELLQRPLNEIVGCRCCDLVHDRYLPVSGGPVTAMQKSRQQETRVVRQGHHWFRVLASPIFADNGNLAGAVHIISDVTGKQWQTDRLLQLSRLATQTFPRTGQEFFHSAVTFLADELQADACILGFLLPDNPKRVRTLAFLVDGKLKRNFEYNLAGTPCEKVMDQKFCIYLDGVAEQFPGDSLLCKQGIRAFMGEPLYGADGRPLGLLIALFRRTLPPASKQAATLFRLLAGRAAAELERERALDSLKVSESRFRSLFHNNHAVMMLVDPADGAIVDANPAACRFYGWTRRQLSRMNISQINTLGPEGTRAAIAAAGSRQNNRFEFRHRLADGQLRDVEVVSGPIRHKGRDLLYSIIFDISERKTAEQARENLQAQLLQAQKLEAVGQLAGGLAHEFNNLLQAMIGYGEILRNRLGKDDPNRDFVERILKTAAQATDLTRCLLTYSRKQPLRSEPAFLNKGVSEAVKLLQPLLGEHIRLTTVLTSDDPIVSLDAGALKQVILNLATNARDAMPNGGHLSIGTEIITLDADYVDRTGYGPPGRYACLTVADSGIGMDEETRRRLFEPFFTTKGAQKGTGLGMAIVYGIIQQLGGYIEIESAPDLGTSFRILLPLAASDPVPETGEEVETAVARGKEMVLLAEDDANLRDMLNTILTQNGYQVLVASDGHEAVRLFEANRDSIDLLLFDLMMPEISGKDAREAIRHQRPDIKVIFLSGYAPETIWERIHLDGDDPLVYKPISPAKLLQTIRQVLDNGSKEGSTPQSSS